MTTLYSYMDSPLGDMLVARNEAGLVCLNFQDGDSPVMPVAEWQRDDGALVDVATQLTEYFGGTRRTFDLPLVPQGTSFQMQVWQALQTIPYGKTVSYGELAEQIDRPTASRAVGAANGKNPLPIVIPCHRVIGRDGALTGYGGGVHIKAALLMLEGALPSVQGQLFDQAQPT